MIVTGPSTFGQMADEFTDWANLDSLKGSVIVVNGWRLGESNFNPGKDKATISLQFKDEPEHYGWSTESAAILDTLKANEKNFPFECAVETRVSKRNGKPYPVLVGA
jgi:hypothetical protein